MTPRTLQVLGEALIAAAEKLQADENAEKLQAKAAELAALPETPAARSPEEAALPPEMREPTLIVERQEGTEGTALHIENAGRPGPTKITMVPAEATEEGPKLDKLGRPWSKEVHSGGKRINKGDGRWSLKRGVTREQEDAHFAGSDPVTARPSPEVVSHGKNIQDIAIAVSKLQAGGGTNHQGINFTVSRALFGDTVTDGGLQLVFSNEASQEQLDVVWTTLLGIAEHLKKEI